MEIEHEFNNVLVPNRKEACISRDLYYSLENSLSDDQLLQIFSFSDQIVDFIICLCLWMRSAPKKGRSPHTDCAWLDNLHQLIRCRTTPDAGGFILRDLIREMFYIHDTNQTTQNPDVRLALNYLRSCSKTRRREKTERTVLRGYVRYRYEGYSHEAAVHHIVPAEVYTYLICNDLSIAIKKLERLSDPSLSLLNVCMLYFSHILESIVKDLLVEATDPMIESASKQIQIAHMKAKDAYQATAPKMQPSSRLYALGDFQDSMNLAKVKACLACQSWFSCNDNGSQEARDTSAINQQNSVRLILPLLRQSWNLERLKFMKES